MLLFSAGCMSTKDQAWKQLGTFWEHIMLVTDTQLQTYGSAQDVQYTLWLFNIVMGNGP